ncbi:MAG: glucose 1-dehydrogenase [Nitrospinae bacterium]|nr:glucose 1-dehydrogenase [Nitrospinota bacterium]
MARLTGKVALISGGARGQGAAEARLFAQEGANIVFGDILDEEGKHVETEIRAQGGEATYVHLDVTRSADWRRAVQIAESQYSKLDVLVNNAGIVIRGTIEETSAGDWDRIMAINMKGVFLGTKYAIPAMRRAGGGSIINISSGAGIAPALGTSAAYAATKGGVRLFTKATAVQHANDRIRCNSVHPGPIDTLMVRGPQTDPARLTDLIERVPLGRLGTAEEIAYGVLYLASDESSFVTGAELVIDGGRTAQ